jgi:hypothetical protein
MIALQLLLGWLREVPELALAVLDGCPLRGKQFGKTNSSGNNHKRYPLSQKRTHNSHGLRHGAKEHDAIDAEVLLFKRFGINHPCLMPLI